MRVVGNFSCATEAVNQVLASVITISKLGCAKTLATCGHGISTRSLNEALTKPLIVFDIDDTLVYNDSSLVIDIVKLYKRLLQLGCRIFLVTARKASMRIETLTELKKVGITGFQELFICPDTARISMASVSEWKALARRTIANKHGAPITLTVGDQWGDSIQISSSAELNQLDIAHGTKYNPWILVRPDDGISCLGLKLPDTRY